MGVSENKGTPKWMVYNVKPYFLMDDLGGFPIFLVQHPYGDLRHGARSAYLRSWKTGVYFHVFSDIYRGEITPITIVGPPCGDIGLFGFLRYFPYS